jgi:hypothetical protein
MLYKARGRGFQCRKINPLALNAELVLPRFRVRSVIIKSQDIDRNES